MRFYCLEHIQDIYTTADDVGRVQCDNGPHFLVKYFPDDPYWEHCCECKATWLSSRQDYLPSETCPACKRKLELFYLCHNCETFGLRQAEDKAVSEAFGNDEISCGACSANLEGLRWHYCLAMGKSFQSKRDVCPFCNAGFFPANASELLSRVNSKQYRLTLLNDLEVEHLSLIAATAESQDESQFFLLSGTREAIVVPRYGTREMIDKGKRKYRQVFSWSRDWSGDLIIERPAIFERNGNGWKLKEHGRLNGHLIVKPGEEENILELPDIEDTVEPLPPEPKPPEPEPIKPKPIEPEETVIDVLPFPSLPPSPSPLPPPPPVPQPTPVVEPTSRRWLLGVAALSVVVVIALAIWLYPFKLDPESLKMVGGKAIDTMSPVNAVAFSPDGKTLASGEGEKDATGGAVVVRDGETGQAKSAPRMEHGGAVTSLSFSPDGKLLASGGRDGKLIIWDTQNWQKKFPISTKARVPISAIAFSPDNLTVVIGDGDKDGTVELWNSQTNRSETLGLAAHKSPVNAVAFSADGKIVASGGADGTVKLWDAKSGSLIKSLAKHIKAVTSLAFSPDGSLLASGGEDGNVIVWDVASGQSKWTRTLSSASVNAVTFCASKSGQLVISGSTSKQEAVNFWDAQNGQLIKSLSDNTAVTAIAVSSLKKLASGSADKKIAVWGQ